MSRFFCALKTPAQFTQERLSAGSVCLGMLSRVHALPRGRQPQTRTAH